MLALLAVEEVLYGGGVRSEVGVSDSRLLKVVKRILFQADCGQNCIGSFGFVTLG